MSYSTFVPQDNCFICGSTVGYQSNACELNVARRQITQLEAENTELQAKLELCHHENCDLSAKVDGIPWLRAEIERLQAEIAELKATRETGFHPLGCPCPDCTWDDAALKAKGNK